MSIFNINPSDPAKLTPKVFFKNLQRFFNGEIRLKTLIKDAFCKQPEAPVKDVRHKGDSFTHVPEFMTNENSSFGMKVRTMKFSPDDEEKMSKMTTFDEMYEYKAKLIEKGSYTYEN